MLNRDRIFFRFVLFNDKATFHNTGQLNRHFPNFHYLSKTHIDIEKLIINIAGVSLYGEAY